MNSSASSNKLARGSAAVQAGLKKNKTPELPINCNVKKRPIANHSYFGKLESALKAQKQDSRAARMEAQEREKNENVDEDTSIETLN